MSSYSNNLRLFNQLLDPSNSMERGRISRWYRKKIHPLLASDEPGYFHRLEQIGGEIVSGYHDGKRYQIEVDIMKKTPPMSPSPIIRMPVEMSSYQPVDHPSQPSDRSDDLTVTVQDQFNFGLSDADLIFFHLGGPKTKPCGTVEIYYQHNVAVISDINTLYDCFTPNGYTKRGRLLVEVILNYLQKHQSVYEINRVVLEDSAYYQCPGKRGLGLKLELSRQLCGLWPYYMQFGFQPTLASARDKLHHNREIMSRLLVRDQLETLIRVIRNKQKINHSTDFRFSLLEDLVHEHQAKNNRLIDLFEDMSVKYCNEFSLIVEQLFDELQLAELDYNESYYELQLLPSNPV